MCYPLTFRVSSSCRLQKAERENAVIAHLVQFFGEEVNRYIEYQEKVRKNLSPHCRLCPAFLCPF